MTRRKVFKKLIGATLLLILLFFAYKGISYYLDNRLYAHYVIESYWNGISNKIDNGYTDKTSYFPGEVQKVFVDGNSSETEWIRLFDIQNKAVDSIQASLFSQSPGPSPSENGFGYQESFEYTVPSLPSGVYTWEGKISFIVKGETEDIVILY